MPQATVKYAQDSPIAAWLADMRAQGIEQSRAIRCALEAYLSEHGNNPPPPPAPVSPAPGGGLTAQDMEDALYNALVRAKNNLGIQLTFGGGQEKAPLNQEPAKNGKLLPPPGKLVDKSVTGRFVDDDGGAEPLDYETESPDEILSSMGMA